MIRIAQPAPVRRIVRMLATFAGAAALCLVSAFPARAHDISFSYVDLTLGARAGEVRLMVHRRDAARAIGAEEDALEAAPSLARQTPALVAMLSPRLTVSADGHALPVAWSGSTYRPERRAVELIGRIEWARPPGHIAISARMFPDNPLHETFVNVYQGARLLRQEVLTDTKAGFDMYTAGPEGLWAVCATFILAGVHHIFIGPDHILFVIGLLLLGGGIGRILKIVSGFTVAHSITLALATLGVVRPPARVIEPLIALSIVYVGLANLRARQRGYDGRALVAFAFGLIHGFGFASVLIQLGLPRGALGVSLAAFNVGVELGQACIVLAVVPVLALLRERTPRLALRAVTAGSWAVLLAGSWWFVERIVLPGG